MISATVLTKNNQRTIRKTLDSLASFPEVVLLDSGSTDETLKIAANYPNVTIHSSPFLGFGPMHNLASGLATHEWILSIDSDEALSGPLIEELHALALNPERVYSIQRHNYFNGKWIKWCSGWHPDFVVRLYNRNQTRFSDQLVHEQIQTADLEVVTLKHPLTHTPYADTSAFIDKMQHYSNLFADQGRGNRATLFQAIAHGFHAFFKSYIAKRGFMGGKEGFIISIYNSHATFYKYLKLSEQHSLFEE